MPLGTFICRDFSVLLVRPTEAPRTCSTNEGGAQKHRRRKRPHAPSVRMFPGTLMGAEARDGYGPMSPSATAIGPSGMGQSSVHSKKTRARGPFSSIRVYGTRPRAANTKTIYQLRLVEPIERPIRKSLRRPPAGASSPTSSPQGPGDHFILPTKIVATSPMKWLLGYSCGGSCNF